MDNNIEEFLPRKSLDSGLLNILSEFSCLLDKTSDFGIQIFDWYNETATGSDENIPIVLTLRNMIELLDSISILIKNSSVDPCKIHLRTLWESYLIIEYMFEKNTKDRALDYLVCHFHKKIKMYKRLQKDSIDGKNFKAKLIKEKINIDISSIDTTNEIQNLTNLLQRDLYKKSEREYQRLVKAGKNNPNWYSFYGGPANLEQLSSQLNLSSLYDILYRNWSNAIHGTDVNDGKIRGFDGKLLFSRLRNPKDAQTIVSWCMNIFIKTFNLFIDKYLFNHKIELSMWYLTIRDKYMEINSNKVLINVKW